tara:strand:- start:6413 stop:6562 length:150 start_codon:yes stop_codon:yes gene_type:complete
MTYFKPVIYKKRAAGIEPASSAWKAEVLPLNYARIMQKKYYLCNNTLSK